MSEQRKEVYGSEIETTIRKKLKNDPLFEKGIERDHVVKEIFSSSFLNKLDMSVWYSTVEACDIIDVPASTARYYVKELEDYIISPDAPRAGKGYRLNYISIIKLLLILQMKDEFKLNGLKTLLGWQSEVVETSKETSLSNDEEEQLKRENEQLRYLVQQMMNTELFEVKYGDNSDNESLPTIELSEKFAKQMRNNERLLDSTNEMKDEFKELESKVSSLQREKEQSMTWETRDRLRKEALEQWETNKGFWGKLFASEVEKEEYVSKFIKKKNEEEKQEDSE